MTTRQSLYNTSCTIARPFSGKFGQTLSEADCKPSSVRVWARFTAGIATFIPLPSSLCDHPSGITVARDLKRPTRELTRALVLTLPYLALHRAGFAVPPTLPPTRCALTAPVRPYLMTAHRNARSQAVCFLLHFPSSRPVLPLAGAPARWCSDFPPRNRGFPRSAAVARPPRFIASVTSRIS